MVKGIRALSVLVLVGLLVAVLYRRFGYPLVGIDDANIFFVYARHLADGHGFVYNLGGEPVEGVTSLLWLWICTAGYAITQHPEFLLLAFNVAATTTVLVVVMRLIEQGNEAPGSRWWLGLGEVMFLVLVLSAPDYLAWVTLTLMDLGVWSLLLVAATAVVATGLVESDARARLGFSVLVGLLLFARPEAMVFAGVLIGFVGFRAYAHRGFRGVVAAVRAPLVTYAAVLAGLTLFRLIYFGFPLPNTFYAKVSPSLTYNLIEGIKYLQAYVRSSGVVQVLMLVLALSSWRALAAAANAIAARRRGEHATFDAMHVLPAVCVTGFVIPLLVGGDHFGSFRFYQPFVPLLVLNLILQLRDLIDTTAAAQVRGLRTAATFAVAALAFVGPYTTWRNVEKASDLREEVKIAADNREAGRRMTVLFSGLEAYPTIAATAAGGIKLGYAGPVFDVFGLNDAEVAHAPGARVGRKNHAAFNRAIFFARAPEIFKPGIALPNTLDAIRLRIARLEWGSRVLSGLFDDDRFRYRYVHVGRSGEAPLIEGQFTVEFIEALVRDGRFAVTEAEFGQNNSAR